MRRITILLFLLLVSCSSTPDETAAPKEGDSPETIYSRAEGYMDESRYKKASEEFLEVERQHPYSKLATKAQMEAAYAQYLNEDYDDAVLTLERFVKLHPGNKEVPYAYYMIALCYYNQISNVARDQEMTSRAYDALKEVIARFPESTYARDANIKLDLVLDHLAGKEMEVGRYYQQNKRYVAAINRFKKVIDQYQTTTHVPEALHRLVEIYLTLGVVPEAQRNASVLGHNYPGSRWYRMSYELMKQHAAKPQN